MGRASYWDCRHEGFLRYLKTQGVLGVLIARSGKMGYNKISGLSKFRIKIDRPM